MQASAAFWGVAPGSDHMQSIAFGVPSAIRIERHCANSVAWPSSHRTRKDDIRGQS